MDSKVEENYKRLREELNERLNNDKRLTAIMDKISKGIATFKDSAEYSQIVADHMGDVISKNIGKITVPLGKEMVCKELLKENIERVDTVFGKVQVSVDEKMGIHLNPVTPPYPTERVNAIAHSLEDPNADDEKVARRGKSSGNVVAARHDENVKANAAWREKAGFDCYLVRDAGGGCCAWCAALAGRYKYADAPDDVFRRHDHCTCTVTYECGKMRQDVWSKESNWSKEQSQEYMRQHDAALAEKRKELRAKGVNVSNAKLNKEEIEAIKARIDASEASKPTVNTPEQAKELERQALEKNPVTKLSPEQAEELEAKILGTNDKKDSVDTSSEVVASQLNDWERQSYSNKTEKGLLILPDGTTKDFGGIEHHVTGKEEDIKLMDGATFTHNHPTDNTFSQNDIVTGIVKGNLKEMRAVTSTGDIHILRNNDASVVDRRKFAADYSQMRMKAENIANKKILRGEHIDKDEYVKGRLEKFMEEHANEYNLSYTKSHINEISIDKSIQSGILESNGNRINIGMQFFSKSIEDFATIILPKDEYAHVMSEIATIITEEQSTKRVIKKHIGDYIYTVENKGFGNYRVIGKDLIE